MSDPIKISIGAIFQIIFSPMSLYLSGLCGKLVNNSPAGVLSLEVPRMTQFGKTYKLPSSIKKFKLPGVFIEFKILHSLSLPRGRRFEALRSCGCGSAHDLLFVFYLTPLEQLLPNCVTLAVD